MNKSANELSPDSSQFTRGIIQKLCSYAHKINQQASARYLNFCVTAKAYFFLDLIIPRKSKLLFDNSANQPQLHHSP